MSVGMPAAFGAGQCRVPAPAVDCLATKETNGRGVFGALLVRIAPIHMLIWLKIDSRDVKSRYLALICSDKFKSKLKPTAGYTSMRQRNAAPQSALARLAKNREENLHRVVQRARNVIDSCRLIMRLQNCS